MCMCEDYSDRLARGMMAQKANILIVGHKENRMIMVERRIVQKYIVKTRNGTIWVCSKQIINLEYINFTSTGCGAKRFFLCNARTKVQRMEYKKREQMVCNVLNLH